MTYLKITHITSPTITIIEHIRIFAHKIQRIFPPIHPWPKNSACWRARPHGRCLRSESSPSRSRRSLNENSVRRHGDTKSWLPGIPGIQYDSMSRESWWGFEMLKNYSINTYRYILVGWTSIYQLFWGSLGTRVLTHPQLFHKMMVKMAFRRWIPMKVGSYSLSINTCCINTFSQERLWKCYVTL